MGLSPIAFRRLLQPCRRGAVLDAFDTRPANTGQALAVSFANSSLMSTEHSALPSTVAKFWFRFQLAHAGRRQISRDAAHARAVGPVRRQLHLEHGIVEARRIDVALTDLVLPLGGQIENAVALRAQFEFGGRAHHAVGDDATHRLLFERDFRAGDIRAQGREYAEHASFGVRRPAHDFEQRLALRHFDLQHLQLVGIRMLVGFDHARNSEGAKLRARVVHAFDLEADGIELGAEFLDGFLRLEMILQPGECEFHRSVLSIFGIAPSPRPYGERVGVRGSTTFEQAAAPHPSPLPIQVRGMGRGDNLLPRQPATRFSSPCIDGKGDDPETGDSGFIRFSPLRQYCPPRKR